MTKRKVPKGYKCDLSTGWHSDKFGSPVIDMCQNLATQVVPAGKGSFFDVFLCDEHAVTYRESHA